MASGQRLDRRRARPAGSRRQRRGRSPPRPAVSPDQPGRPGDGAPRGAPGAATGRVVVAKALSRFYPVFEELTNGMPPEPGWRDSLPRFLADGQYRNPGGDPASFTTSYFHRPEELTAEIADAGLEVREFLAISGNVKLLPGLSVRLDDPEERAHVLSVLRLAKAEPSLIGLSQNFVAIAALPANDQEVELDRDFPR